VAKPNIQAMIVTKSIIPFSVMLISHYHYIMHFVENLGLAPKGANLLPLELFLRAPKVVAKNLS
jgi:hypothetical protein